VFLAGIQKISDPCICTKQQEVSSCMPKMDLNQLAKHLIDVATSSQETGSQKDNAAVRAGRLGGKKGGTSRAKKLTPERRAEIAKKAAEQRWRK
jgi:hypothetical protein